MAYDVKLANRIREYLVQLPHQVEEKEMFSGLVFMVNDKMCINVSGENLMCRIDPALHDVIAEKRGFQPMIMKGKELKGYCYVHPLGFQSKLNFEYWVDLCLDYNKKQRHQKRRSLKAVYKHKVGIWLPAERNAIVPYNLLKSE